MKCVIRFTYVTLRIEDEDYGDEDDYDDEYDEEEDEDVEHGFARHELFA